MYHVPTADPLEAAEGRATLQGKQDLADAIALAGRVLPPALAQLVVDELAFHAVTSWSGMPPRLLKVVAELTGMGAP